MINPTTTPPDAPTGNKTCALSVPLTALANEGGTPAPGDAVNLTITGTVASVNGDNAQIDIETVNGNPVDDGDGDEAQSDPEADAMSAAEAADSKQGQ